jgi:hypothetical protein
MRPRDKKLYRTVAILGVIAGVGFGVLWQVQNSTERLSAIEIEEVRKELDQATPVGSSHLAVVSYLDSPSIPHSQLNDSKFPSESRGIVELALIRNTSKSLIVRGDFQIRFRFDETAHLLNYSVEKVLTGL